MRWSSPPLTALLVVLALPACRTPGATDLDEPGAESRIVEIPQAADGGPAVDEEPAPVAGPPQGGADEPQAPPEVEGDYAALEYKGVAGGRFRHRVDAGVEEVLERLLDFEKADGHRAWAREHRLLARRGDSLRVRWSFNGKAGIDPEVVLGMRLERGPGGGAVLRFRILEDAFGLAAFFGDWTLEPDPTTGGCFLTHRVFIDSGLAFANASPEEIEAGLREDARLLLAWIREPQAE